MDGRFGVVLAVLGLALGVSSAAAQSRPARGPWVPTWTVTYGGFRQVDALAALADGSAWALDSSVVTVAGVKTTETAVVRYDGGIWRVEQVVAGVSLEAIAMADPAFGFAVGDGGAIYRWDGRTWRAEASPVRRRIVDVALRGRDEGWAVGDLGTLVAWDGVAWTSLESPVYQVGFTAVALGAPGEAWALARDGQVIRHGGDGWVRVTDAPRVASPQDMAFGADGRGLIVGRTVAEWRDGAWRDVVAPAGLFTSVAWSGDTAYVAVDGALQAYRDGSFAPIAMMPDLARNQRTAFDRVAASPQGAWAMATNGTVARVVDLTATIVRPEASDLGAIDMLRTDFGWAGGTAVTHGFVGTTSGAWDRSHALPEGTWVTAIDLASDAEGWALGKDAAGDALMWRWDGASWSAWPIDKTWDVSDVQVVSRDEAWASRGNIVVRWDGTVWAPVPGVPADAAVGGMAIVRGGADVEAWFGSYGYIHHLHDGVWDWMPLEDPGPGREAVTDVEMVAPDEGWAITSRALFRFDGETWRRCDIPSVGDARILDISAPEPGNAWVLVLDAGLFHWDGGGWEYHDLQPMGVGFQPRAVTALRPPGDRLLNEVWMAGAGPSVGRYRVVTPVGTVRLPALLRGAAIGAR